MNATNDGIIKADRRGRLRYTPEQKSAMVDAYQASGLSGPRFAALHGVKYQTLAGWLQKRRRKAVAQPRGLPGPALLSFVAAELREPTESGNAMEIMLTGGTRISVSAPGQVRLAAALIRELEKPLPC
jgi:transposase-like protein